MGSQMLRMVKLDTRGAQERCDYGTLSCSVCSPSCQLTEIDGTYCGDGLLQSEHEICDDGNTEAVIIAAQIVIRTLVFVAIASSRTTRIVMMVTHRAVIIAAMIVCW